MIPSMQQNPDGSWSEAIPLGWQGSGIDWEVYNLAHGYEAQGFDEDVMVAKITARTKIGLQLKIRRWHRKTGTWPNHD